MVPDNSTGIPRVPAYSGGAPAGLLFEYGALTRYGPAFQPVLLDNLPSLERSYYPGTRLNAAGLGSSPFARRYWGNRCYFLFLQVLRCFSSLRSPPGSCRDDRRRRPGCPIRKSAGQGIFAPYRGLSQLITSFIASVSQGIRHAPLLTLYRRHLPQQWFSHHISRVSSRSYFQLYSFVLRNQEIVFFILR